MLYNPKWEAKTEPSLEGFIAWLETKDPNEEYDWSSYNHCAAGCYAMSVGITKEKLFQTNNEIIRRLSLLARPPNFDYDNRRDTFGACLSRACQVLAHQP